MTCRVIWGLIFRACGSIGRCCRNGRSASLCFTASADSIRSRPATSRRPLATACLKRWMNGFGAMVSCASRSSCRVTTCRGTSNGRWRSIGLPRPCRPSDASTDLAYCLDFNERCPDVQYVLECLGRIRARSPEAFERILYIEQPTARDLQANRQNVMHEAARLRPIVIDESLTDLESLVLAREMGYTGVALKACKGQSQTVLMAAAAQKHKLFLCVQDLTCPGASLIHSVGISARVPAVAGIEANARQYVPAANEPWRHRFPGIFTITDGYMRTEEIGGPGLGIPDDMVPRMIGGSCGDASQSVSRGALGGGHWRTRRVGAGAAYRDLHTVDACVEARKGRRPQGLSPADSDAGSQDSGVGPGGATASSRRRPARGHSVRCEGHHGNTRAVHGVWLADLQGPPRLH